MEQGGAPDQIFADDPFVALLLGDYLFDAPDGFARRIQHAAAKQHLDVNFMICHYPAPGMRSMICLSSHFSQSKTGVSSALRSTITSIFRGRTFDQGIRKGLPCRTPH